MQTLVDSIGKGASNIQAIPAPKQRYIVHVYHEPLHTLG